MTFPPNTTTKLNSQETTIAVLDTSIATGAEHEPNSPIATIAKSLIESVAAGFIPS
jgi:hypothetical protein